MAAIYTPLNITWKGKQYKIKADFDMIQRMELANLDVLRLVSAERPNMITLARFYAFFLNEAGEDVTGEDVYIEMTSGENAVDIFGKRAAIVEAIFPHSESQDDLKKNQTKT